LFPSNQLYISYVFPYEKKGGKRHPHPRNNPWQEIIQEIPEVQIIEKVVEVPRLLKQPQLVEEIIHVKAGISMVFST
jgi:hypothetical protein